jgi:outer membrane protein assembly factor BamD (BamD/ComL family)
VLPTEAIETPDAPAPKADARSASGALTAELGVLDMARSKLADGDAKGALVVLDEYSRTYPRGRLGLEAEVLRIDALSRAGETGAAKKRAEAFVKKHPKSVLAPRVRRYLDEPR